MHAPGNRWTAWIAIIAVVLTLGCRGTRPFSRFVSVSEEPDSSLPEIEAPRQRLATAKPRTEVSISAKRATATETRPDPRRSAQVAASEPRLPTPDRPHIRTASSATKPAPSRSKAPAPSTRDQFANKAPSQKTTAKSSSKSKATIAKSENSDLVDAFGDYPPEVQREALRQLVAATAAVAERTEQPNALEKQLADNVSKLPELPEAKNTAPDKLSKRLASDSKSPSMVSQIEKAAKQGFKKPTITYDDDLASGELESTVVQSITDLSTDSKSQVKPASATQSAGDDEMIAQAAVTDRPLIEEVKSKTSEPAKTSPGSEQDLYAVLLKQLSTAPADESEAERTSRLIKLRHLMVLAGNPDDAVQQIEGMSKAEQEYLRHQLLGLWTMIDPQGHPVASRRFSSAVPQMRQAAQFAAAATDALEVRALAFCTEIESYGQIKPFPSNRFDSGQQVIMYCEIENFTAKQVEQGFETNLQGSYDIYNAEDEKVVSQLLPADDQVSANYLRDYFIAYQMYLPQQLSAGKYRIQLTIEDVNGKKYGQSSLPFEIK